MKNLLIFVLFFLMLSFCLAAAAEGEKEPEKKQTEERVFEKTPPVADKKGEVSELTPSLGVFIAEDPYVVLSGSARVEAARIIERQAASSGKYEVSRFPDEVQRFPAKEKCDIRCKAELSGKEEVDFFVSLSVSQLGDEIYLNGELVKAENSKLVRSASVRLKGADSGVYNSAIAVSEKLFLMKSKSASAVKSSFAEKEEKDYKDVSASKSGDEQPDFEPPLMVNTAKVGVVKWEGYSLFALQHEMSWGGSGGYFYFILPQINLTGDTQLIGLGMGYKYRWYFNFEKFHPAFELFGGFDGAYLTYRFEYHDGYPGLRYGGAFYYQFTNQLGLGLELSGVSGYVVRIGETSHKMDILFGLRY